MSARLNPRKPLTARTSAKRVALFNKVREMYATAQMLERQAHEQGARGNDARADSFYRQASKIAHKARALETRLYRSGMDGPVGRLPNSMFDAAAVAGAKRVTKSPRQVVERETGERGEVIQVLPGGWLKVQWRNRDKPTLIKRSELKRSKHNPARKPKYKLGAMVYSYQNRDYKAPVNFVRDNGEGYAYSYRLSLRGPDEYKVNSNWIDEGSLSKTPQRANVEGYMDGGTFHPIRGTEDYNEFLSGDMDSPAERETKQRKRDAEILSADSWDRHTAHKTQTKELTDRTYKKRATVRSLSQFVRARGGIVPGKYMSEELKRLGRKESGTTGLLNQHARQGSHKQTAEYVMDAANTVGYGPYNSVGEFIEAVEADASGRRKSYSREDENAIADLADNPSAGRWYVQAKNQRDDWRTIGVVNGTKREALARYEYRETNLIKLRAVSYEQATKDAQAGRAYAPDNLDNPGDAGAVPYFCADCDNELVKGKAERMRDRRVVCNKCARAARAQREGKQQRDMFVEQDSLFNPNYEDKATRPVVTIEGVRYQVLSGFTPSEHTAQGRARTAELMREHDIARELYLKKPGGTQVFISNQFTNGNYSKPKSLGRGMTWEKDNPGGNTFEAIGRQTRKRKAPASKLYRVTWLFNDGTSKSFDFTDKGDAYAKYEEGKFYGNVKRVSAAEVKGRRNNPGLMELAGGIQAADYLLSKIGGGKRKRNAERAYTPNAICNTCGRKANDPFRSHDQSGKIVHGCIDDIHTGHLVTPSASSAWHNRPAAKQHRAAVKKHLQSLTGRHNPSQGGAGAGATSSDVRSPTRTSTEVRSPTKTSTVADTRGNITVTGGAGAGATTKVIVRQIGARKPNPTPQEMSERFQGHATGAVANYYASSHAPRMDFSRAGRLIFLKVNGRQLRLPGCVVAIDPRTEKLWIASKTERALFNRKAARAGEVLDFGEADGICYLTAKQHIGSGKRFEYVHAFGEEGGRKPRLCVDHEGMPVLRGGDYKIRAEGIVN